MTHQKLLEAALFMSSRPLMLDELGKIAGVNSLGYVKEALQRLQKEYEGRGMEIVSTPQGWIMQVRGELLSKVAHLTPYSDISEGCKRTLALIAYKEPAQQSEIIKLQGNKAYSYIKDLHRKNLVKSEKKGRTRLLRLTQEFERYFGEEKERIKERLGSTQQKEAAKAERNNREKKASAHDERQMSSIQKETEARPAPKKPGQKEQPEKAGEPPKEEEKERKPRKSDIDHILT